MVRHLKEFGLEVTIFDPWVKVEDVFDEYGIETVSELPQEKYHGIVHAVAHQEFRGIDITTLKEENAVVYDVKGVLGDIANGSL